VAASSEALENIYATVSPQVVNITVVTPANLGDLQLFQGDNNTPNLIFLNSVRVLVLVSFGMPRVISSPTIMWLIVLLRLM
jgi:hypothetical protein